METENSLKPGFPDEVVTPYPIQVGIAKEPSPNGDDEGAISVGRNGGNGDPSLPVGWKRVEVFTGEDPDMEVFPMPEDDGIVPAGWKDGGNEDTSLPVRLKREVVPGEWEDEPVKFLAGKNFNDAPRYEPCISN